jgi:hypothetical protein
MPFLKNPRHEAFAQAIARGSDATEAYGKVYPKATRESAGSAGARLLAIVRPRVAELQGMAEDETLLTIAEKRKFCADALRTPVSEIDETSPLCLGVKRTGSSVEYKTVDKLKALQLDNELARHGKPEKQGPSAGMTVDVVLSAERLAAIQARRRAAMAAAASRSQNQ